jgi:hypothetical protein
MNAGQEARSSRTEGRRESVAVQECPEEESNLYVP